MSGAGSRTRELLVVGTVVVAAALLALLALGRGWITYEPRDRIALDPLTGSITGRRVAQEAQAGAFLALASVLALVATRGTVRRLLGLALVAAGVMLCAGALSGLSASLHQLLLEGVLLQLPQTLHVHRAWPLLTFLCGVLVVLAGLLTGWRGGTWASLGSSYEAPGARADEPATDKGVWEALDRGDDPTA